MVVTCAKYHYYTSETFQKLVSLAKNCDNCGKSVYDEYTDIENQTFKNRQWIFDTQNYKIYVFCSEKCLKEWAKERGLK